MLTKIFINDEGYEVNLLTDNEVIKQIKEDFIGNDGIKELSDSTTLNTVIAHYIDYYEKVEYNNKEYFILKSRIPVEFKQKTHAKKFITNDEMGFRVVGSILLPITFITTNIFSAIKNIKNKIKANFGSTKINAKYDSTEVVIGSMMILVLNILFYILFAKSSLPFWSIFIVQAVNFIFGILNPISYQYNQIANYKLSAYTFDSKYEVISDDPLQKLKSMKPTQDKKKIDFDFSKEEEKIKEKTYAQY